RHRRSWPGDSVTPASPPPGIWRMRTARRRRAVWRSLRPSVGPWRSEAFVQGRTPALRDMAREIVLDTETTGFDPKTGDRLIEVGCIEIEDLLPTGRTFHRFINPERLIPPDAIKVHGITDDKVKDAPKFHEVVDDLMEFLGDAPLIAHNANFDRNFIDFEIGRIGRKPPPQDRWIDT